MPLFTESWETISYSKMVIMARVMNVEYVAQRRRNLYDRINDAFDLLPQERQDQIEAALVMEELTTA